MVFFPVESSNGGAMGVGWVLEREREIWGFVVGCDRVTERERERESERLRVSGRGRVAWERELQS